MSKGVFIEGITVDMLRNACLEAVEELMNEGDMVDMEVKPNEWIPCSERLPDDSDSYLITTSWGDVEQIWFAHKKDYNITESEWRETDDNPVAWMPLPEPYKGGDEA